MLQLAMKVVKWVSIPVLLIASIFSGIAAGYGPMVDCAICLGAALFVPWQVRSKKYFWAAGFAAVVLVLIPLPLVDRMFLLMGFTCIATLLAVLAAFRTQPVPAV